MTITVKAIVRNTVKGAVKCMVRITVKGGEHY